MKLNFQHISDGFIEFSEVTPPQLLTSTHTHNNYFVGGMLFLCVALFAISRAVEGRYIRNVAFGYAGLSTETQLQKDDLRIGSLPSIMLFIAYIISSWICWTLLLNTTLNWKLEDAIGTGAIIVLFMSFYTLIGITFTSWITGEWAQLKDIFLQNIIGFQFISLLYFLIGIVWFMNPHLNIQLFYVFVFTNAIYILIRWIKGIIVSLMRGIKVYYIILYFCTLEILPIFVVYYIAVKNFNF